MRLDAFDLNGCLLPHFTSPNTNMCAVLFSYKWYKHKTYWFNCSSDVPNAGTPTPHCLQCVTTVVATGTALLVSLLRCLSLRPLQYHPHFWRDVDRL